MAIGVNFKTLVDIRPVGGEVIVSDYYDIPGPPAAGSLKFRINELPLDVPFPTLTDAISVRVVDPITHVYSGGQVFTAVYAPVLPLTGQFQIDGLATFKVGTILFNGLDGGKTVEVRVTGRGSLVFASDVNDPRDEIKDARGTYANIGARLTAIVANIVKRVDYVSGTPSGTYTGSATQFDLPWTYTLGVGLLFVYVNGLLEVATVNYNENNATRFTFTSALPPGARVSVVNFE